MWNNYYNVATIEEALDLLDKYQDKARLIAGGTDLILEIERGVRKNLEVIIDISRLSDFDKITLDEDNNIHLGPLVTHNDCVASKLIRERALPLAEAAWEVGSPQIRNRGTIAGNLVTASPANDTISPLIALNATLTLRSKNNTRQVLLKDFYTGVRKTILYANEMVEDISFPAMEANQKGSFIKFALRKAQAISLVNVAVIMTFEENLIKDAIITLGAVAPTIIHAAEAEEFLVGKQLSDDIIQKASKLAQKAGRPISDVRGSNAYRYTMIKVVTKRALEQLHSGLSKIPTNPVLLANPNQKKQLTEQSKHNEDKEIVTTINGKTYHLKNAGDKSLLRLIREDAGLIGTKEGCAEGECGACTVILDDQAVMSCLVPAERAHKAVITTVEGYSKEDEIHPVQKAFIEEGAVQCGYCTPGFIMSAVKLLEEKPTPTQLEIKQAISGNLCRCTGYYKIISAIEKATEK
ncbi:MAG: hypothetical protein CL609_19400 [Anaerolineaceae bacterium]|nr:hypothetical protein [Anaerolineaceae bacterium]